MAETTSTPPPSKTDVQMVQELLKANDDTSKFVGLALLKSVLDNGRLTGDPASLKVLWEGISPKFLDRLLRAQSNNANLDKTEAKNMVDLAAAVLHFFSISLPDDLRKEPRFRGRIAPLVKSLIHSSSETTEIILQTLLSLVSQTEGALELLKLEDLSPLTAIAPQYPLALQILGFTWANASAVSEVVPTLRKSINRLILELLSGFKGTDAVTFMNFIASFLPRLPPEAIPQNPQWLGPLVLILQNLVTSRPTLASRAAYTQLAAVLLQIYPVTCPSLLFKDAVSGNQDSKPFSYLFVNLLLIDLRSSFPSLLAKLNSHEYTDISQRLAAAFDVVSSFVGFLVRTLDDESSSTSFSMPPDLLLKLRKDIAETMSLTIEYLRDRWDASIAGAPGLHPSARAGAATTSEGSRLTLTWDSMKNNVDADPLVLAGIRALSIWVREDENQNLRNESAGLMDMFLELYKTSSLEALDFRPPILLALEGILTTDESVDVFLGQQGWQVISLDLESILRNISNEIAAKYPSAVVEASRGLEIVRVMLTILDHPSTTAPREEWMTIITTTRSIKAPSSSSNPLVLELHVAMLQLATALLSKASGGMQKRYVASNAPLSGLAEQLKMSVNDMDDKSEATELTSLLDDVTLDLGNLFFKA
ncbi:hypothetical protein B7494_g745 [Chlorociboria aeruginascens]|nr:hypothetical protein B7494_g745 [Chlorociboria aeruginascens]